MPPNPGPGVSTTISATIFNRGDVAVSGAQVAFYQGDPAAGGVLIGTQTVSLVGNSQAVLTMPWSLPGGANSQRLYVVADPQNLISEWNEENNQALITAVNPDLVVDQTWVAYGVGQVVTFKAAIRNTGTGPAAGYQVSFRLDDPVSGTEVAQVTAASLEPGANAQVVATWNSAGAQPGQYSLFAVVDPMGVVVEASKSNNVAATSLTLLPDLIVRPADLVATFAGNGILLNVTVWNAGTHAITRVPVAMYDSDPWGGPALLAQALVDIPAGGSRTVTLSTTRNWWPGVYVMVNPGGTVPERTSVTMLRSSAARASVYPCP